MAWIKISVNTWKNPVFVNMDNAIYIRHNQADPEAAVIGFNAPERARVSIRTFEDLQNEPYTTKDHELRILESVDDILQIIDAPLALINRMTS